MTLQDFKQKAKLSIDNECVEIYVDNGEDKDPTHFVYWHIDEIEEDASVALTIANTIRLFYTDKESLFRLINSFNNNNHDNTNTTTPHR